MLLITGVSGYIGAHLADRCRQAGMAVRGLVRTGSDPRQVAFLESIGVEVHAADLEDEAAWQEAMRGVRRVMHLIGSIQPARGTTFEAMHVGLSRQCVAAAQAAGVEKIVYLSALNAAPGGPSRYYDTKGRAEQLFRSSGLPYAIVRPALVCGHRVGYRHSKLMAKLVRMARSGGPMKTVGDGRGCVQPLHVDDLAECCFQILTRDDCTGREFDLAGPEVMTTDEMLRRIAVRCGGAVRPIRHVPRWLARAVAFVAERLSDNPILTTDQIRTMSRPMLADPDRIPREFGFRPRAFEAALADYGGPGGDKI